MHCLIHPVTGVYKTQILIELFFSSSGVWYFSQDIFLCFLMPRVDFSLRWCNVSLLWSSEIYTIAQSFFTLEYQIKDERGWRGNAHWNINISSLLILKAGKMNFKRKRWSVLCKIWVFLMWMFSSQLVTSGKKKKSMQEILSFTFWILTEMSQFGVSF